VPAILEPLPHEAPMVDPRTGRIASVWYRYFSVAFLGRLNAAPYVAKSIQRPNQAAAIGATSLSQGSAGLYRVSWFVRITQAATVSSSLTVTIAHTDGGVNVSQAGAAVGGNTITTLQSGIVMVRADAATAITFAVAYTSAGATPMLYTITVAIETVNPS
jgi:hypothetical protein